MQGKLLIGTFNGLGIYTPETDSWKILTTKDGIKSNNVEVIEATNNNEVCISHGDSGGTSCILKPNSLYSFN
ncbi:MAG: hypothetical protein M1450_03875 [Patescibacteria group bacterium]|nr:hypothetical protein [Patescibacteria group bacterium]